MTATDRPSRPRLDQMTDDDLDKLYDRLEALEQPAPASLRDQYAEALRTTPRADCADWPADGAHGEAHTYDIRCALCTGDVEALANRLAAVRDAEMQQLRGYVDRYRIGLAGMSRRSHRYHVAWRNARQRAARYQAETQWLRADATDGYAAELKDRLADTEKRARTAEARVAELEQALADADATQLHTDGACEAVQRAETAEAALDRVRATVNDLCDEPHPTHDHICPDDVRRYVLDVLDGPAQPAPQS